MSGVRETVAAGERDRVTVDLDIADAGVSRPGPR